MTTTRIFRSTEFMQPSDGEPIRSVITQSAEAVVVAWYVKPGQFVAPHVHPKGQDTWTVLSGRGDYQIDAAGATRVLTPGDIAVAPVGAVHGVTNNGAVPLVFISVVAPADAGFESLRNS